MVMDKKKSSRLNPGMLQDWENEKGPVKMTEKEWSTLLGENQD